MCALVVSRWSIRFETRQMHDCMRLHCARSRHTCVQWFIFSAPWFRSKCTHARPSIRARVIECIYVCLRLVDVLLPDGSLLFVFILSVGTCVPWQCGEREPNWQCIEFECHAHACEYYAVVEDTTKKKKLKCNKRKTIQRNVEWSASARGKSMRRMFLRHCYLFGFPRFFFFLLLFRRCCRSKWRFQPMRHHAICCDYFFEEHTHTHAHRTHEPTWRKTEKRR